MGPWMLPRMSHQLQLTGVTLTNLLHSAPKLLIILEMICRYYYNTRSGLLQRAAAAAEV